MSFHPFVPPRSVREYLGQPGPEIGDLALPPIVLDAHAAALSSGGPEEFCVVGFDQAGGGPRRLRFEVTRAFVEATTDFRHRNGKLRFLCPECGLLNGEHSKGCVLA